MTVARIDFETHSACELKDTGVYVYGDHPTTDVWCMAYAIDDGPVILVERKDFKAFAAQMQKWLDDPNVVFEAHNANFELVITNRVMTRRYGWPHLPINRLRCTMAAAYAMSLPGALDDAAAAVGLETRKDMQGHRLMMQMAKPRRIERPVGIVFNKATDGKSAGAAVYIGRPSKWGNPFVIGKDGTREQVIAKYEAWLKTQPQLLAALDELRGQALLCHCAPQACHGDVLVELANQERVVWWDEPEKLQRLYQYCPQDVVVQRELSKRIRPLSPAEQEIWELDQKINETGVMVDQNLCRRAQRIVDIARENLDDEIRRCTENHVQSGMNAQQLKNWLVKHCGVDTNSVSKDTVADLLADLSLAPNVRRALEIRQEASKTSVAKIQTLLDGMNADGRARGLLQYHAAHSGRWGGRRFQPQNLPRPALEDVDQAIGVMLQHKPEDAHTMLEVLYERPISAVSDAIRGMIASPKGRKIVAADLANIEGRVTAWWAGEEWKLDAFRSYDAGFGPDLYAVAAGGIFGVPPEAIDKKNPRRQIGKVSELALGYQGGVGAFVTMSATYGLAIEDYYDIIWDAAQPHHRNAAEAAWEKAKKRADRRMFIPAEIVKLAWRENHPATVALWYSAEDAVASAIRERGETFTVNGVSWIVRGSTLWCRLPSGRLSAYMYPKLIEMVWAKPTKLSSDDAAERLTRDEAIERGWIVTKAAKPQIGYKGVDSRTRKWGDIKSYGGKLVENVVQAIARDVMASGMVRADRAGYAMTLTVHDELVAEAPEDFGSAEHFAALLAKNPGWAAGLPLAAEGWSAARYGK